jgi:hypothetical protein
MTRSLKSATFLPLVFTMLAAASSAMAADRAELVGRWRGTSICTKVPGNEFCHDETVQYDFEASATDESVVELHAQKLVDGAYQPMYEMDFRYDEASGRWVSKFHTRRDDRDGRWSYAIKDGNLTGTCVLLPDTLVRNVKAMRIAK